ncbi:MAG: GTP-binding protein [Chitinophagales bacterium]
MGNLGRRKSLISVIVLGQKDHGKTTLSAAIPKALAEEDSTNPESYQKINNPIIKENQGLKIKTSEIEYESSSHYYRHTDLPTHMDIAKSLVSKAVIPDFAIIVVSTPEGVMPETREQISLAYRLNIPNIVVFLNKCDLVDDEEAIESAEWDVKNTINELGYSYDDIPFINGSALGALNGESENIARIRNLVKVIEEKAPLPTPLRDQDFLMPIDEVISITGRGTCAIGTIEQGIIHVQDNVSIVTVDYTFESVVTGVQKYGTVAGEGGAGENVGLLLRGIDRRMIQKGGVIAKRDSIQPHRNFKGIAYLLTKEEGGRSTPIPNEYKSKFYINLFMDGTLTFPRELKELRLGTFQTFSVQLAGSIAMRKGDGFTIREGSKTVGVGIVLETL